MISNSRIPGSAGGQSVNGTFSADVKLHLYVGDQQIELGQLGPGFAILRVPQSIDATNAEIETIIDKKVTRWPVRLTTPITPDSRRFAFESV